MRHVERALQMMDVQEGKFISVENAEDKKGVAPVVKFTIQSDPIGEVGVNGVQATDMLMYVRNLFESLDSSFPCEENKDTIDFINKALARQVDRTRDRQLRGVEGTNQE